LKKSTLWQTAFVRDNFPVIGYFAWKGFKQKGWGILVCNVDPLPSNADLRFHTWNFITQFVSNQCMADCLLEFAVPPAEVTTLVTAIQQYNPYQEIMILIRCGKSVEVCWLKNLASTPLECYEQVLDRWDEFMLDTRDRASI
jgi:hypothetical protein